jgi:hypothetical protein
VVAEKKVPIAQLFADGRRIDSALRPAVRRAVLEHERKNVPLVVWRRGKTELVSPAEVRRALKEETRSPTARRRD